MIKASCEIPASAHTVYHTLCDLETRREWDQAAENFDIVEELDTSRAVCYTRIAVILPSADLSIISVCRGYLGCSLGILWTCDTWLCYPMECI